MQGPEGLGTARDKTVVKVNQAEEFPQLMLCEQQRKVPDDLYFVLHRTDSLAVLMETKEVE